MCTNFKATEALLSSSPFTNVDTEKDLFVASYAEMARHHLKNSQHFAAIWTDAGFSAEQIKSEQDVAGSPFIMVNIFKEEKLISCSMQDIVLTLTSSGTGGQKSEQHLDAWTLNNIKKLAKNIYRELGLVSTTPTNYLCFTYDPVVAKDLGTAFSDEVITSFATPKEIYYAFKWDSALGDFAFDEKEVLEKLYFFAKQKIPLRILGFPAFLHKIIESHNVQVGLAPESFVLLGGGWKGHANKEINKGDFRLLLSQKLGIPLANIRDSYGLVEHGIPYVDCSQGRLHIPNYARVFIRSPRTLKLVPNGTPGLIQLLCTYNSSYPCLNVLTTDYGIIEPCDCEIGGPTLRILGRAGTTKHKGCAVQALSLIKRN